MKQRIELTLGEGLDRSTGQTATGPGAMRDVRNAVLGEGKASARAGYTTTAQLLDDDGIPISDVVGGWPLRAEGVSLVVGYAAHDRQLHLFRLDAGGAAPERVGVWGALPAGAAEPPLVTAAEGGNVVLLAHDEGTRSLRLQTVVYNPLAETLVGLTADLDGNGSQDPAYFRGVCTHLGYAWGWGFGSATEPKRPELVRNSLPGKPATFEPNDYAALGTFGDPVVACVSFGRALLCFKRGETHQVGGWKRSNFSPLPYDTENGLAGPRLWIKRDGSLYTWAHTGPRRVTGDGSEDLSLPLDLDGPQPADLVAAGETARGFAVYEPGARAILWIFGRRVYAYSLTPDERRKWSYYETARELLCGWSVPPAADPRPAPTGAAEAAPATEISDASARLHWNNVGADGDETVEIYLKPSAAAWDNTRKVATPLAAGAAQSFVRGLLTAGTSYDVAFRLRRGGKYRPDFEGFPDAWPASSRATFITTQAGARLDGATWSRQDAANQRIRLTLTPADLASPVAVFRGASSDPAAAAYVESAAAGALLFDDSGVAGGTFYFYFVATETAPGVYGPLSDPRGCWAGIRPPNVTDAYSTAAHKGWVVFENGPDPFTRTELWTDAPSPGGELVYIRDVSAGEVLVDGGPYRDLVQVGIRHVLVSGAVEDASEFALAALMICMSCPPAEEL